MTLKAQKDLFVLCSRVWCRLRPRHRARLREWEWDDIRAAAIARVFQQYKHFDNRRSLLPWVYTVMWRAICNGVRDLIPSPDSPFFEHKMELRFPRRLITKVVEEGEWGDQVVVVERDVITPEPPRDFREIEEFATTLPEKDRKILDLALAGTSKCAAAKTCDMGYDTFVYHVVPTITEKWKAYRRGERCSLKHMALVRPSRLSARADADLAAALAKARSVKGVGNVGRKNPPRCPRGSWLRKRLNEGVTADEWNHLRTLWPELPADPILN